MTETIDQTAQLLDERNWAVRRLLSGDLGLSSKALLAIGLGGEVDHTGRKGILITVSGGKVHGEAITVYGDEPFDSLDFGRCLRTYADAPESAKARMHEVLGMWGNKVAVKHPDIADELATVLAGGAANPRTR